MTGRPPAFADRSAYAASLGELATWAPVALAVCRRHGLAAADDVRMGTVGTFPVVVVGGRWAVKLCGPWWDGAAALARERDAYAVLAARPDLPVPRLVADGDLGDGWSYLVLSALDGPTLRDVPATVAVARWLGEVMAAVHALDVPPGLAALRAGWDGYLALLARQRAGAVERHRGYGTLAPHLLDELGSWLPEPAALADRSRPASLLHGDLHADHVVVDGDGRPAGVIDLNDAVVGDPRYEHGPLLDAFRRDRRLLAAYRAAAGEPDHDPRTVLATALLHDFDQLGDADVDTAPAADLDDLAARVFGPP